LSYRRHQQRSGLWVKERKNLRIPNRTLETVLKRSETKHEEIMKRGIFYEQKE
jgi:hypothetical protein